MDYNSPMLWNNVLPDASAYAEPTHPVMTILPAPEICYAWACSYNGCMDWALITNDDGDMEVVINMGADSENWDALQDAIEQDAAMLIGRFHTNAQEYKLPAARWNRREHTLKYFFARYGV